MTPPLALLDVRQAGNRILAAIVSAAAELDVELPERQLVWAGGTVYDSEMVSAALLSVGTGIQNAELGEMNLVYGEVTPVWNVTYEVVIVRTSGEMTTAPRGNQLPTVAAIQSDADRASGDCAVLAQAAMTLSGQDVGLPTFTINIGQTEGGMMAVAMTGAISPWVLDS